MSIIQLLLRVVFISQVQQLKLALSTEDTLSVCLEEDWNITCTTNDSFIRWNISSKSTALLPQVRFLYNTGSNTTTPFCVNMTRFHFLRTSVSPLTSMVTIFNATQSVNGSIIACSDNAMNLSIFLINVIPESGEGVSPVAVVTSETFGSENVTVILEWSWQHGLRYQVNLVPDAVDKLNQTALNSVQLTLLYNVTYNVSVLPIPQCGKSPPNIITKLHYVKCNYPPPLVHNKKLSLVPDNLNKVALVGTNVSFMCNHSSELDLVLTGPNTITCTSNGEWQPNPLQTSCKVDCGMPQFSNITLDLGISYGSTLEDSTIHFKCKEGLYSNEPLIAICHHNGAWMPNPEIFECIINNVEEDIVTIIGGSFGAVIAVILASTCTVTLACLVRYKASGVTVTQHRQRLNVSSMKDNDEIESIHYHQLSRPVEVESFHPKTVTYADIGPLSIKQPKISAASFSDNHVEYAQLDHKKLTPHNNNTMTVDNNIIVDIDQNLNLDTLLMQLQPEVTHQWYEFGEAIGIDKNMLSKWMQYPPEQNIIEVCDFWLRNHTGKATWREIAEALRNINNQQLAFEIDTAYETGKLPKYTSDKDSVPSIKQGLSEDSKSIKDSDSPPPVPPRLY